MTEASLEKEYPRMMGVARGRVYVAQMEADEAWACRVMECRAERDLSFSGALCGIRLRVLRVRRSRFVHDVEHGGHVPRLKCCGECGLGLRQAVF